jgi:hypothetical protein
VGAVVAGAVWLGGWGGVGNRSPRPTPSGAVAAARTTTSAARAAPTTGVDLADSAEAPASVAGWRDLVAELYARRAQAFTTGSAALLGDVYTSDSPALAADERALATLGARRQVARGFAPRVDRVTGAQVTGDAVELRLVDSWPAYRLAGSDPESSAEETVAARPEQPVRMQLARTAAGWRIATVTRLG